VADLSLFDHQWPELRRNRPLNHLSVEHPTDPIHELAQIFLAEPLLANCVVLENESREGFDSLLAQFVARFGPADGVELGLIEEMLSAFWRQRRAWAMETRIMDTAISREPPDRDELTRLADAFTAVAVHPQLELMHRYETRLHRIFQRALSNLIRMRALTVPEKSTLPNEPSKLLKTKDHPDGD
jgi:hypothetical protein